MNVNIPAQIVVYALGCLAVIVVIGAIAWTYSTIERRITRKREQDVAKEK